MGMRGKKKKVLTQEKRKQLKEFSKYCMKLVEYDFLEQLLNGNGCEATLIGVGDGNIDRLIELCKTTKA